MSKSLSSSRAEVSDKAPFRIDDGASKVVPLGSPRRPRNVLNADVANAGMAVVRFGTDQYPTGRVEGDDELETVVARPSEGGLVCTGEGAANLLSKSISENDIKSR